MEPLQNVVLEKSIWVDAEFDEKEALHVAFGIDANFALGMGVLMFSMLKNNPDLPIVFHVFTSGLYPEDLERLRQMASGHRVKIKLYSMNVDAFKNLPTKFVLPPANYFRFVVADTLYGEVDKVLYVDADVLCTGSLAALPGVDLGENIAGAVEDLPDMAPKARKRNFGFTGDRYFNAGVLFINVKQWKEAQMAWKAIDLLSHKNRFRQLSQDVLNLLFKDRVHWMENKYNHIYNLGFMEHPLPKDTVLIHLAGNTKPWQVWGQRHFLTALYQSYQNETPWKEIPLIRPKAYKHARFMAQYHHKHHETTQSWLWSVKYIAWKLKAKLLH